MPIISKLLLASALALPLVTPAMAQDANWSQHGDYYAPTNQPAPAASARESKEFREGDFYAPTTSPAPRVSPQESKEFHEGDYYAPEATK
jgi:hypothetical protein